MRRITNTLIITILTTHISHAQSLKKGFQLLQKANYSEALVVFGAPWPSHEEVLVATYGKAQVYRLDKGTNANPDTAYILLGQIKNDWPALNEKQRKKLESYDIKLTQINTQRKNLEKQAYNTAIAAATESAYSEFLRVYQESSYTDFILGSLREIELTKTPPQLTTPDDCQAYYQKFGLYFARNANSENVLIFWELSYKICTADSSLQSFVIFERQYPDYPHKLQLRSDKSRAWLRDYKAYLTANPRASAVWEYEHKNPLFPFPEVLAEDKKSRWPAYYLEATINGESAWIRDFQLAHQNYPEMSRIESDLALTNEASEIIYRNAVTAEDYSTLSRFIKALAPRELAWVAVLRLMRKDLDKQNWKSALDTLNKYAPFFAGHDYKVLKVRTIISEYGTPADKKAFPKEINTPWHEYLPVLTADENTLYFISQGRSDALGYEDIWYSEYEQGKWQKARLFPYINTPQGNEAVVEASTDGNRLLFFIDGDIHYADRTPKGWTSTRPLSERGTFEVTNHTEINSTMWEADPTLSSNGKVLIFTSDRPGGVPPFSKRDMPYHGNYAGNTDLYASFLTDTGWSRVVNLGYTINTPFCERNPFLHPDMKTLYFSSDGHPGLGRLDVFKTTRLYDTSWVHWSEPVNLGKYINSPDDDWGYRITTKGDRAVFAAMSGGYFDLFEMPLSEEFRPQQVITLRGKITDPQGNVVPGTIRWEDLSTGIVIGESRNNPTTGEYFIVLPKGKAYGYYVDIEGFFPSSGNIDLTTTPSTSDITQDLTVVTYEDMQTNQVAMKINNLFFDYNKYELKPESFPELNRLAETIIKMGKKVEIAGHTDNTGAASGNQTLSENRAASVRDYLVSRGCSATLVTARGYGATRPIATNDTPEGRANNRRVEMRFVE